MQLKIQVEWGPYVPVDIGSSFPRSEDVISRRTWLRLCNGHSMMNVNGPARLRERPTTTVTVSYSSVPKRLDRQGCRTYMLGTSLL